ncbi:MAG: sensor histidine kinase [Thermomicrobiales bacterium]
MTRRLPFRIRLTIWYGVLFGVMLIVLGVLLYAGLRWRLYSAFDDQLQGQANLILSTIQPAADAAAIDADVVRLSEEEYVVRLLDSEGETVTERGSAAVEIGQDRGIIDQALEGDSGYRSIVDRNGERLRIYTMPIRDDGSGSIVGVLQVGLDRGDLEETLTQMALGLIVLIPLSVAVAVVGGYVLSGPALRPVAEITLLANSIGERDLGERLNDRGPSDELGKLAATFDAMLARIEGAFERQRRFTGDAAHELRTPLSLMRSQVDIALSRPRSADDYRQALEGLDADLERLTGLTATLLSIARLDSPGMAPEWSSFDLAETISSTLAQYRASADDAGVVLTGAASLSPLLADEDMMIQVLVNLLDNALAHTVSGGRITVGCAPGDDTVQVWVTDTGAGIAAEDQARVFDRFYRPDTGRSRAHGGAGLGLAICKAILEAHRGTIGLTSTVGVGTTVDIHLPRRP